jgi:glycosyltransferase involved in cell wall biosynthesis
MQEAKVSERFGTVTKDFVIPLGVQLPNNEFEIANGKEEKSLFPQYPMPIILFMSRIDPKKGLNLLIPALEKLLAVGIDFHFVLAGSNPQDPDYENQIQAQVKASLLSDRTTITGFVSGDFKTTLLQNADLFVLPSYYENFGISVAEAMYHGIPVVISDQVYIWKEVENAEAGWVAHLDVDNLTQMLRLALQDASERKRRGLNGKEYALKNYSWSAIAKQTIQAYQQIIALSYKLW